MKSTLNSKQLVRAAFEEKDLPRLPVVPFIFKHAARLEQVSLREIYADPTRYVRCLQNARKLYGYDAIIAGSDASLEAELAGCGVAWGGPYDVPRAVPRPNYDLTSLENVNVPEAARSGRFSTVIESLRRINSVSGPTTALGAVITGPLQLAAILSGRDLVNGLTETSSEAGVIVEAAAAFLLKIVQVYCQLELDIIIIADNLVASLPAVQISWLSSLLCPLVNTIHFYNAYAVVLPLEASPESAAHLVEAGVDGVVACTDLPAWNRMTGGRPGTFGLAVPSRVLDVGFKEMQEYLRGHLPESPAAGVFLSTDGEVPPETPPDNLHLLMNILRK